MTTDTRTPSRRITDEVTSWPGVEAGPGRRGEFAFTVSGRSLGHLHGDHAAHFGFPKDVGAELREQGRVGPHPVAPDKTSWAARRIEDEADVLDVIELLRLNYDRIALPGIHATPPAALPFAPKLHIRAFLLERPAGNLLIYSTPTVDEALGEVARQYLNHWHEAAFGAAAGAPLFVNEADREGVEETTEVAHVFSKRHVLDGDFEVIPTPGHTPGATAYLWESRGRRHLFTGDTIYLDHGEWVAAVLDSSDRASYLESLELIRDLDFDVLVPWAATVGEPYHAATDRSDARRRIDAIIARVRSGEDR